MSGGFGYFIAAISAASGIAMLLRGEFVAGAVFQFLAVYSLVQAEANQ